MKVLLIDVNCKNSSTGKIVYNLYNFINSKGDEASICYGRGPIIVEKNIFKFGIDIETCLHAFLTRITGYTGCFSYFSTKRLIKYIKKFKPDVVHIHEMHAYFLNIGQLLNFLGKNNIRIIHTLHCEFSYTGKCGHSIDCDKWKTECSKCPYPHNYITSFFFDRTKYMFNKKRIYFDNIPFAIITTVSPWLTNRAKQSFLNKHTIKTIYNGVDTNVFYPRDTTKLKRILKIGNSKVVVSVAPHIMDIEKGGIYIEQLAREMKDVVFILVGTDEQKMKRNENVIYVPRIFDQNLLAEYYSIADVFVICSLKETFSLTCVEALCCGTPIAGFKCGAPEEIFDKPYARFVEYGDVSALDKIIKIQFNSDKNDVKLYGKNFSIEKTLEQYYQLYKEVVIDSEGNCVN